MTYYKIIYSLSLFFVTACRIVHAYSEEPHDHQEDHLVKLTEEQIKKMGLQTRSVEPGNLFLTLSTPGKIILHPDRLAHIIPKVPGVVREANKNIGDPVKAEEVIAILESNDIAEIKAAYLIALSKQHLAFSILQREKKLYQEKVSAKQDYLTAQNVYEEALLQVHLTKQKLHAFGFNQKEIEQLAHQTEPDLRFYPIRSPIRGTVIMRRLTKGEFIENTTTIYEVADLSTVWVEIGIYPKDLYRVKEGQLIDVRIPIENKHSQARLIYVSPVVATDTITAKAIAELDNSQGLWRPGVFVNVNITTEKIPVSMLITKEAIQSSKSKDFVFVVTPQGFERRFVKLGQSDQNNVEIISGLNLREQYVVNKSFLLKAELDKSSAAHEHH